MTWQFGDLGDYIRYVEIGNSDNPITIGEFLKRISGYEESDLIIFTIAGVTHQFTVRTLRMSFGKCDPELYFSITT